jgi:sterol desaturase/sphingolipid hydroxylase (fatty acid hydroxylase superfamily)
LQEAIAKPYNKDGQLYQTWGKGVNESLAKSLRVSWIGRFQRGGEGCRKHRAHGSEGKLQGCGRRRALTFGKSKLDYSRCSGGLDCFSFHGDVFLEFLFLEQVTTMSEWVTSNEATVRLAFFFGILLLIALFEILAPRRALGTSKGSRWFGNLGVVVIGALLLRIVFPITAVQLAFWAGQKGWGLFNAMDMPFWLGVVLSIIILDFIIYLQHVMFHAVPTLWRLHMMHHADLDYDLTTGIRFHPIEILISMVIKFSAIVVLGTPAVAVILFEIILNGMAMFNHGNFFIPLRLDRVLRWFVVTPDMHRVHHSVFPSETNSNYGFNLAWWDRVMGTYRAQPRLGHQGMTIGLNQFRDPSKLTLLWMLILPFVGKQGSYAINRRGAKEEG